MVNENIPEAPSAKAELKEEKLKFSINLQQNITPLPEIKEKTSVDLRYPLILPYAYVHIYWDEMQGELIYNVEEPNLDDKEKEILELIKNGIEELINLSFISVKEKESLIEYLEKNVGMLLKEFDVKLEKNSYLKLMYYIYRDFIGMNKIEPFMNDYYIEDIECNGIKSPLYIVHRRFGNIKTNIIYEDSDELNNFVEKLAQKCGKYISYATPLLDGVLPDGSIDYNEPIIFRKNGRIRVRKIGVFVDKYYNTDESNKPVLVENIEVPAFDPKTLKIEWRRLDYVYRHKINEKLYYLKLETGRNIKLTGSHSIFVLRKGGLKSKLTSNIKKGDYVAVPLWIPESITIKEFNLAKELSNRDYSNKIVLENIPYNIFIKKKEEIKNYLEKNYKHPYEAYYELREKGILPINLYKLVSEEILRKCRIKTTSSRTVPAFLKIDKHLMRLLGYYVSEGWFSNPEKHKNYDIMFSFNKNEKKYHKEIIDAVKSCFDQDVYIEPVDKNAVKLKINSYLVWHIFKDVLRVSKYAKNKKVPDLIYNVSKELRQEFISCYKKGDYGSSASERLLSDISYLNLFDENIMSYYNRERVSLIGGREIKSKEYYTNNLVRGYTDYFKTIPVEIFNPINQTSNILKWNKRVSRIRLKKILNSIKYKRFEDIKGVSSGKFLNEWTKRGFLDGKILTESGENVVKELNILRNLINSDLAFVKVMDIKRTNSSSDFVYDVSVKNCENFIGGFGGICCHNSRVNATFTEDVSSKGPTFTIRKFTREPWSPVRLMQMGTVSAEMLAYLWLLIENNCNILVVGGTGSGKTTFLNVLAFFIPPQARIVSIEDTRELKLLHENWLPSVARAGLGVVGAGGEKTGEITLFDLLRESFRQRPDYVIVGEIRGKEAYVLFQGMASGHPSLGTMHADDVATVIRRLETPPINLSPSLVETLDAVCLMTFVRVRDKEMRKLRAIEEIISVDENGKAKINTPFSWDPRTNKFLFKKESNVLNEIVIKKGISREKLDEEFSLRSKLLLKLYQENIFDFNEVQKIIHAYYKTPERVLKRFNLR